MKGGLRWGLTVSLWCVSAALGARTITVGPGGGYEFAAIQPAIDAAAPGDEIVVQPGTYGENIRFKGKRITVRGVDPADLATVQATIIDGNSSGSVVTFAGSETSSTVLAGFTIRNGAQSASHRGGGIDGGSLTSPTLATIENNYITSNSAWDGGAIAYCNGTIRHNIITSNTARDDSGGIHRCNGLITSNTITRNQARDGGAVSKCDGVIEDNLIAENAAFDDGGGAFQCNGTIRNNTFRANWTGDGGGGLERCNGTISGNVITSNSAGMGGGLNRCDGAVLGNTVTRNQGWWSGGGVAFCNGTVQNNLIAWNVSPFGGGGAVHGCGGAILNNTVTANSSGGWAALTQCYGPIRNCIVWGNSATSIDRCTTPTFSCIENWTSGGLGNINSNPQFVNAAAGDWRLAAGSPCINTGASGYWWAWPQRDAGGNCRLAGARVDIGCFEYGTTTDADGDLLADADELSRSTDRLNPDSDGDGLCDGLEVLRATNPAVPTPLAPLAVPGGIPTIQEALACARDGEDIIVATGLYEGHFVFCGTNPVLRGTNPTSPTVVAATILDATRIGPVVTFQGNETSSCALAGFTIRNGLSDFGGGVRGAIFINPFEETRRGRAAIRLNRIVSNRAGLEMVYGMFGNGGAIACCAGTIEQNTISSNSALFEGGALFTCDGAIQDNWIVENRSGSDGGGAANCDGVIQNNLFVANRAGDEGGALSGCDGSLLNNTITSNSAVQRGGGVNHCYGIIRNCVVWNNSAPTSPNLFESNPPSFSCIQGWAGGGVNNITSSPLFVNGAGGDYHLAAGSPCIDTGVNFYWYAWPERDLDGNCRLLGSHVDVGCYEFGATPDTDGDLFADTAEPGINASLPDRDGDGLRDGLEMLRESDPDVPTNPETLHVPVRMSTVQQALCLALPGEEILVAPGLYEENVHLCGFDVTLHSDQRLGSALPAILDGGMGGPVITLTGNETPATLIEGLTIRNGHTDHGGGIQGGLSSNHTSATIQYNLITGNQVIRGGGGMAWCDGLVSQNTVHANVALNDGGGVTQCHGIVQGNDIFGNRALNGGGVAHCHGLVQGNRVSSNTAENQGGGVALCNGLVRGNEITLNSAVFGGGVSDCEGVIEGNVIARNVAGTPNRLGRGGAIAYSYGPMIGNQILDNSSNHVGGGIAHSAGDAVNNVIARNNATIGGGTRRCSGLFLNNTIVFNRATDSGGGMFNDWDNKVVNCIIWGNTAHSWPQMSTVATTPTYSCIENTTGGLGNINRNPRFAGANVFRLLPDSPCVDAATNAGAPATDIEGRRRPIDGNHDGRAVCDMGAYEYSGAPYSAIRRHWMNYR